MQVQRKFLVAELPSHEETGAKELTFPWPILLAGWPLHCQGTHFFSAHSLRRMVAPPPNFFPNLHKRACSQGIGESSFNMTRGGIKILRGGSENV